MELEKPKKNDRSVRTELLKQILNGNNSDTVTHSLMSPKLQLVTYKS